MNLLYISCISLALSAFGYTAQDSYAHYNAQDLTNLVQKEVKVVRASCDHNTGIDSLLGSTHQGVSTLPTSRNNDNDDTILDEVGDLFKKAPALPKEPSTRQTVALVSVESVNAKANEVDNATAEANEESPIADEEMLAKALPTKPEFEALLTSLNSTQDRPYVDANEHRAQEKTLSRLLKRATNFMKESSQTSLSDSVGTSLQHGGGRGGGIHSGVIVFAVLVILLIPCLAIGLYIFRGSTPRLPYQRFSTSTKTTGNESANDSAVMKSALPLKHEDDDKMCTPTSSGSSSLRGWGRPAAAANQHAMSAASLGGQPHKWGQAPAAVQPGSSRSPLPSQQALSFPFPTGAGGQTRSLPVPGAAAGGSMAGSARPSSLAPSQRPSFGARSGDTSVENFGLHPGDRALVFMQGELTNTRQQQILDISIDGIESERTMIARAFFNERGHDCGILLESNQSAMVAFLHTGFAVKEDRVSNSSERSVTVFSANPDRPVASGADYSALTPMAVLAFEAERPQVIGWRGILDGAQGNGDSDIMLGEPLFEVILENGTPTGMMYPDGRVMATTHWRMGEVELNVKSAEDIWICIVGLIAAKKLS
eukprot:gnl/TRDRNA2_/TRDRNA2_162598_c1_seq1.p1 gnl/TRDRNA2_/TRDRNA2_162598_c1~~gnl/TRDRNA2_/TRDRNA2_162598_c1_seq1.p1  ORF type:complete len:596 (+),score=98.68 gnl/TRDRNA2_/TRDRNA2_162598_c1_seq1:39-1826(+)